MINMSKYLKGFECPKCGSKKVLLRKDEKSFCCDDCGYLKGYPWNKKPLFNEAEKYLLCVGIVLAVVLFGLYLVVG
jgi:transcription elongation factor Elf1